MTTYFAIFLDTRTSEVDSCLFKSKNGTVIIELDPPSPKHKLTFLAFEELLLILTPLFDDEDKHNILKKDVIPPKFHEADPEQIVGAYERYIDKNPSSKKTSVLSKLKELDYHAPYELYHDLKLACGVEIVQHAVGSEVYCEIDQYFHSSANLLLKEVERMGLAVFQEKERDDEEDMLDAYREEFDRMSKSHLQLNQECVTYLYKYEEAAVPQYNGLHGQSPPPARVITQPLFSGLTGRSILDTRNTTVPDPYLVAKVIGSATALETGVMKSFSYGATRMPAATPAIQVLDSFFHPNWYTVEAPVWLTYKQKTLTPPKSSSLTGNADSMELRMSEKSSNVISFAPTSDLKNAVISTALKLSVWFNDIGYKKLKALGQGPDVNESEKVAAAAAAAESSSVSTETVQVSKTSLVDQKLTDSAILDAATESALLEPKSDEIKLANLVAFTPEALSSLQELKEERDQIKSARDLQKIISYNLLKLQKLRQKRFLQSTNAGPASAFEMIIYKKTMKLFTILINLKAANGKKIELPISKKLPVLLNDYPGVLPGSVSTKSISNGKTGRLASIRASYKKKSRFL